MTKSTNAWVIPDNTRSGITQPPRCSKCGREDVQLIAFKPPDKANRDFVVAPNPTCEECNGT